MKVLVVDDELDVKELFEQRFRKEIKVGEIEFAFANSGEEALAYMSSNEHQNILILSDINMPGMSGLELLKNLRENFEPPVLTIMMITAYADSDNYNEAIKLGADEFITKPVDFSNLKTLIKSKIA